MKKRLTVAMFGQKRLNREGIKLPVTTVQATMSAVQNLTVMRKQNIRASVKNLF